MSKEAFVVDRSLLETSIKEAEKNGPLSNLSELWKQACAYYNEQMAEVARQPNSPTVQFITPSVVYLRTKNWQIPVLTKAGQKGRPRSSSGVPKEAAPSKKTRAEKLKSYASNFAKMRRMMPRKFHKFINRAEAGSIKEAVRTKCLDCSHFEKKEITNCKVKGCPLFPYRPYQSGKIDKDDERQSIVTTLPVIGNLQ